MKHELKVLPCYFEHLLTGDKTFEIRNDRDRGFQRGDVVVLREHSPHDFEDESEDWPYSGRELVRRVSYVTPFEQKPGWVVFGLRPGGEEEVEE